MTEPHSESEPSAIDANAEVGPEIDGEVIPVEDVSAADEETGLDIAAQELRAELELVQDRHLRLAAEFENFRKRTARERTEAWGRAQADLVGKLLDPMDDLDRVSELDPAQTSAQDIIKGVELVERKFLRELESAGMERVGKLGEPFDPNLHEAIGSVPAQSGKEDQTIGRIVQAGYKLGNYLIRPAKVQVAVWQNEDGASGA